MSNAGYHPSGGRRSIGRLLFEHVPAWITAVVSVASLALGYGAGYSATKLQSPAPVPAVGPSERNPGNSSPLPDPTSPSASPVTIRHEGMVLLEGNSIQLDSKAANWNVGNSNSDLQGGGVNGLYLANGGYELSASDSSSYSTCADATGYSPSGFTVNQSDLEPGQRYCAKTNGNRYSLVRVEDVSAQSGNLTVYVVTWDGASA